MPKRSGREAGGENLRIAKGLSARRAIFVLSMKQHSCKTHFLVEGEQCKTSRHTVTVDKKEWGKRTDHARETDPGGRFRVSKAMRRRIA